MSLALFELFDPAINFIAPPSGRVSDSIPLGEFELIQVLQHVQFEHVASNVTPFEITRKPLPQRLG